MPEWSEWKNIKQKAMCNNCGVYKIRLVDSQCSPIKISRFLDKDENGILQMGRSKDVEKRIKYFRGAIKGRRYSHAEGKRLYLVKEYSNFKGKYNNYGIQYSFRKLSSESEVKKKEEQLLKCYFKRYGEIPPLNSNLPNKEIKWEDINCD